ncbi:MAG TPA: MFS transporter [Phycisphaerae bacterium]|nr:MFS transporter [Phycisphaerae bacterium]HRR85708.1 MFS transporter [Phycisphaerae bacterium]
MASTTTAAYRSRQPDADAGALVNRILLPLCLGCAAAIVGSCLPAAVAAGGLVGIADKAGVRAQTLAICLFMFPFFLLGPFGGLLADRLPRRGLMIAVGLVATAVTAGLVVLTSRRPLAPSWNVLILTGGGIALALLWPAKSALLPGLVSRHRLARANAASCALVVLAVAVAVLAGGYLADRQLPRTALLASSVSFLFSSLLLCLIRQPAGKDRRPPRHVTGIGTLRETARYICGHRRAARLILLNMLVWGCGALIWGAAPTLMRDVWGRQGVIDVRVFQSFLAGGLLVGALILTSIADALRGEAIIAWSLPAVTLAIAVLAGLALLPMSSAPAFWAGAAAAAFAGTFFAGATVACNALLQRIVPNRLRGGVFGMSYLTGTAALLAVVGALGIPRWSNLSDWIGWVLLGAAAVVTGISARVWSIRLRHGPLPPAKQFWWNLNEFYCKWWFRFRREGACTVPAEGAVIVVANHTCGIDPLLLIAGTSHRLIGFLVAEEYTHIPIGGRLIRMIGCVPVRRDGHDAAGTRAALRHLRDGRALGIFIEGGIPEPGEVREPKLGAAMLALHSGALIVPAHIWGTHYDENIARSFFRRHHARVRFGKPIDLSRYWIPSGDKEALRRVSLRLLERIRQLGPGGEMEDDAPINVSP